MVRTNALVIFVESGCFAFIQLLRNRDIEILHECYTSNSKSTKLYMLRTLIATMPETAFYGNLDTTFDGTVIHHC